MTDKKVKVEIDETCDHDVDPTNPVKLKKTKDALDWRIKNDCPSDQKVLFCVYDAATGALVNPPPFDPCTSDPPGLKIGTTFTVKSDNKARLKCTGNVVGKYKKLVLVGDDVPAQGCPPQEPIIETHRLGVEIIPMALAGMVMVMVACGPKGSDYQASGPPATQAPASAGVTAESPSPLPSPTMSIAQVKPVTVTMSGSACGHHVLPSSERLNKTNRDALGWRIRNNCAAAQKVLICAYRGQNLFNPFLPCVSNPTTGLDIGKVLTVEAGERENLDCEANVPGNYATVVLVGSEVPSSGCPRVSLQKDIILTHRLGVEIIN